MSSDHATPLRQELEEAIAKVRHRIETESLATGATGLGPTQQRSLLDELASELARLEEALAGLGDNET